MKLLKIYNNKGCASIKDMLGTSAGAKFYQSIIARNMQVIAKVHSKLIQLTLAPSEWSPCAARVYGSRRP